MATIHIHRDMRASQERVFAALDDHGNMGRWLGPKITVVRQVPDGGVGTIRRINGPLGNLDEEVIERDAPNKIAYRIIGGLPGLVHHRGDITVAPKGDRGSAVDWTIELELKVPGAAMLLGKALRVGIGAGLAKLDRQLA